MKFILNNELLRATQLQAIDITEAFIGEELDPEVVDAAMNHGQPMLTTMQAEAASITYDEDTNEFTIEIRDDVIVRCVELYVRVAKFLGPIYRQCIAFSETLKQEIREIEDMVTPKR